MYQYNVLIAKYSWYEYDMYDMQNSCVAAGDSDKSLFHSIVAL